MLLWNEHSVSIQGDVARFFHVVNEDDLNRLLDFFNFMTGRINNKPVNIYFQTNVFFNGRVNSHRCR